MKKLRAALMTIGIVCLALLPIAGAAQLALAQGSTLNIAGSLQCGTEAEYNPTTNSCQPAGQTANLTDFVKKIINILSWIVGVVSVVMIIIAGFKYVTSGGSDSNVASAKNTILYAIVGLVIVALAQVIVRFVLSNVAGTSSNTSGP